MPTKVLRILNRFNLGGPIYNAAYLTKYMSPEFETLLIGGQERKDEANSKFILEKLNIEFLVIPEIQRDINPVADFLAYQKIKKIIQDFKPDIVHTHASKAGVIGRKAAKALKAPVIVHTFHGHVFDAYFGKNKSNFYCRMERYLAKITDKIIVLSENQQNDIVEKFKICSLEKTEIIPLGLDLLKFQENISEKRKVFREKYNIKDDEVAIGIIGRLIPIKNHSLFIDAFRNVYFSSQVKIRAFIVGDGESKKDIQHKLAQIGLPYSNGTEESKTIVFTSWEKDIDYVNAGMDIIALSSLNEGTPVSLIEAQASNKPIVTTGVGGVKDIVIEGETALVADINKPEEFTEKLKILVKSPELRKKLSQKGWEFVNEKFHYNRLVNDMKKLYYSLLEKNDYNF